MQEERQSIFRQKSLDRISSPEELDKYLQVTTPGTWMSMGAVIIILIGSLIWAAFGHLDTRIKVAVLVENAIAVCYVPEEKVKELPEDAYVEVMDDSYYLKDLGLASVRIDHQTDPSVRLAGELSSGNMVCPLKVEDSDLEDGIYEGSVVVEILTPMHFLFN